MADEELVVQGRSLRGYAAIYAAVAEGFPLEVVLESAGIPEGAWAEIDAAWCDALAEDLGCGGDLSGELDRALLELQEAYRRPVPPLDDDLGAWMRFLRAWTSAQAPVDMLREHGLEPNDALRLQRAWSARMAADPALMARGAAHLAAADGSVPPMRKPAPMELRAPLRRELGTRRLEPSSPPRAAVPSLLADLPSPDRAAPVLLRGTRVTDTAHAAEALRTVLGVSLLMTEEPDPSVVDESPFDSIRLPEGFALPVAGDLVPASESAELSLVQYAALGAELEAAPERADEICAKYGLATAEARGRVDGAWQARLTDDPATYAEWRSLHRHFKEHFARVRR